jgi:hypothetical protein
MSFFAPVEYSIAQPAATSSKQVAPRVQTSSNVDEEELAKKRAAADAYFAKVKSSGAAASATGSAKRSATTATKKRHAGYAKDEQATVAEVRSLMSKMSTSAAPRRTFAEVTRANIDPPARMKAVPARSSVPDGDDYVFSASAQAHFDEFERIRALAAKSRAMSDNRREQSASAAAVAAPIPSRARGRFGKMDQIIQSSKASPAAAAASTKTKKRSAHPAILSKVRDAVHSKTSLRLRASNEGHEYELRAKPVPGNEHVIAFATCASRDISMPTTVGFLNTETGEVHTEHESWVQSMYEEGATAAECLAISGHVGSVVDALAEEF